MKNNLILTLMLILPATVFGQVIIGTGKTAVTNSAVSLEFGTENKGIVLPYADMTAVTANAPGTMLVNRNTAQVLVRKNDGSWFDLTRDADATNSVDVTIQTGKIENADAKVSIGTPGTSEGILVLEDTNKAMILPTVSEPHLNIRNPEPGTIVYDSKNKILSVFNGTVWSFWQATF